MAYRSIYNAIIQVRIKGYLVRADLGKLILII